MKKCGSLATADTVGAVAKIMRILSQLELQLAVGAKLSLALFSNVSPTHPPITVSIAARNPMKTKAGL